MARILLIFDRQTNAELISERLRQHHDMVSLSAAQIQQNSEGLNLPFDLCLIDGQMLEALWPLIEDRRAAEAPVLLPVVLIVARDKVRVIQRQLWQVIEEVVTAPIEAAELQARVEILLRARQFSLELRQANLKLAAANEELQEMNRLKSRFVSMASHEFRNPLSAIAGYIELLEGQGSVFTAAKRQEFFQHIRESLKRLLTLVDDVLVIGRVGVGKLRFDPQPLNLSEFCRTLITEIQFSTDNRCPIQFEPEMETDPPEAIAPGTVRHPTIDANLLHHILTNLLSNVIKYSPEGSPVQLSLSSGSEEVRLQVQDQGRGIPPEDQLRLFEPFHRAANVGRTTGTGLGLAIVKQCVELHGGQIQVQSEVGIGTTVTVALPQPSSPFAQGSDAVDSHSSVKWTSTTWHK